MLAAEVKALRQKLIDWDGKGQVKLTGPAEEVFSGDWPG